MSESHTTVTDISPILAAQAAFDERAEISQLALEERRAAIRARHPAFNRGVYGNLTAMREQKMISQHVSTGDDMEIRRTQAYPPLRAVVAIEPIV